jgi:3-hydroxy acid dehydrogenase / malonic semialdehyde reductase
MEASQSDQELPVQDVPACPTPSSATVPRPSFRIAHCNIEAKLHPHQRANHWRQEGTWYFSQLLHVIRCYNSPNSRMTALNPTSTAFFRTVKQTLTRTRPSIISNLLRNPALSRTMATAMGKRLSGKTIIVTGASSGIGKSTAIEFARTSPQNLKLILTARRIDTLKQIAADINKEVGDGVKVLPVQLDVSDPEQVWNFIPNLPEGFRDIDVLVNNAGLVKGVDQVGSIKEEDIKVMFDTNVTGLINMTQAVLAVYKKRGESGQGDIINIGSIAGREGYPGGSIYCATKAAVRTFTDAIRRELIATRIRVIEIDPGQVETEFSVVRFYGDKAKADAVYKGVTPLTPDDIAETVVFAAGRPENVVIADMLIFPNHQVCVPLMIMCLLVVGFGADVWLGDEGCGDCDAQAADIICSVSDEMYRLRPRSCTETPCRRRRRCRSKAVVDTAAYTLSNTICDFQQLCFIAVSVRCPPDVWFTVGQARPAFCATWPSFPAPVVLRDTYGCVLQCNISTDRQYVLSLSLSLFISHRHAPMGSNGCQRRLCYASRALASRVIRLSIPTALLNLGCSAYLTKSFQSAWLKFIGHSSEMSLKMHRIHLQ